MEEETSCCQAFNKDWWKIIGVLVLVGLGILSWFFGRPRLLKNIPRSQSESPTVIEESRNDWELYTGLSFTIKYPLDWKAVAGEEEGTGTLVTLTDLPSGGGSMTVRLEKDLTLAELLAEKSAEEITLGGFPAMRTEVEEGPEKVEQTIFVEKGEVIYEVDLRANKSLREKYRDLFNLMLQTFQFTE